MRAAGRFTVRVATPPCLSKRSSGSAFWLLGSLDFERELPRLPTGKLYKRLLKDRYWGRGGSKIVQE